MALLPGFQRPPSPDQPLELFRACHGRIRGFLTLSRNIGEQPGHAPPLVQDAAQRLVTYFTTAFLHHAEDEDRSLSPRLTQLADASICRLLDQMTREHRAIDEAVTVVLPSWRRLAEAPGEVASVRDALLHGTDRLTSLLEPHLLLEEREIFPAAERLLNDAAQKDMAAELRARRNLGAAGRP